ncbi:hypothetical protein [Rhodobacter calidifons]|uniref:Phytanoyl-CoA dioxygenase PhyH n=1 Tax=Rhodobacter calidifons TaxID=2715277 RepID=A0ABX0GB68_9RHOB|nr:hypothetical protein [Rhodobacter calidifons]NHB78338.1 hypothetical protein [Rhodobacter calidifons]
MVGPGWQRIGPHPAIAAWAAAARSAALDVLAATTEPWRCGGTWFVGVDALPNAPDGSIDGTAFPWQALPLAPEPLHRAQLSVIRPGYPQPSPEETPAAFAFRRDRDAAHLDGLLPIGPDKRRMVKEPHAWILGLPLNDTAAAPLTVWEGSHDILRAALRKALNPHPPETWGDIDITEAYQAARKDIFATCRRIELHAKPGEATLLHRLTLHGVAPWKPDDRAPAEGRMIAYFRPLLATAEAWLDNP